MIIGGHVSAAGGLPKAVERAVAEEFEVMQLFPSPPQSFRKIAHTPDQGTAFKQLWNDAHISSVFFHAIYLLNLATPRQDLLQWSMNSIIDYMRFGHYCGTVGSIVHVGNWGKQDMHEAKQQVIDAIKDILADTPDDQNFVMENAAGASKVGSTLEQLQMLFEGVGSNRLRVCFDTQHAFATGLDVRDTEQFGAWLDDFDRVIGIEHLVCVHANDSKTPFASGKDRHENIGEGSIGKEGFKHILAQPLLRDKPFILEVPGFDDTGPDAKNRKILQSLI
ncbi:MAG: deoxyribonuclease IV [Candidatus Roizmanbacteria bacterium]|nr:deoxyribonuclease IV [Candidatus Roizmanbacteria bacterium]